MHNPMAEAKQGFLALLGCARIATQEKDIQRENPLTADFANISKQAVVRREARQKLGFGPASEAFYLMVVDC